MQNKPTFIAKILMVAVCTLCFREYHFAKNFNIHFVIIAELIKCESILQ